MFDALRGYVQLANGLSDVTRQRAVQVARQLVDQGGGVLVGVASSAGSAELARQVQGLAEDVLATSRTNRDLLVGLIRTEVDRAVGRLGLVGADELSAMARIVERLQNQLDAAIAFGGRATGSGTESGGNATTRDDSAEKTSKGSERKGARRAPVTFAAPPRPSAPSAAKAPSRKRPAEKPASEAAAAKKRPVKAAKSQKTAKSSKPRGTPASVGDESGPSTGNDQATREGQ